MNLFIMDIHMPQMDDLSFVKMLRRIAPNLHHLSLYIE